MTLEKGNIDQKWKKSSRGLFLEYPSKYNIIGLFYCTVHYCVKPKVLTPDGLNVTNMTQEDLTMTLDDFQRASGTLRDVDEKVKIWSDVTDVLLRDSKI